ncbi:MAG: M48 family metalloprotease [Nitratireductor sp.]
MNANSIASPMPDPFRFGLVRKALIGAMAGVIALTSPGIALAQKAKLSLIRDAEIEGLLRDYTKPVFQAAGLGKGAVDIYVVNDDSFNAFVTGRRMFINTGALKIAENPNEIIGVLAHETGHIVGGHQNRLRDRVDRANIMAALAMVAGVGAALAGGEAGGTAGQALALGSQSAILRDLLAYRRSEEAAADSTAIELLNKTQQSGKGILKTFERFSQDILFSGNRIDPYLQSHPMPRDRIALLEETARKSQYFEVNDPAALQLRHDMARAKIVAYTGRAGELQSMFRNDPQGPAARYGLAISLFLRGSDAKALPIIERLIKEQPNNAYLHEMQGEMLLRGRNARAAVAAYQKAVQLDPWKSGLIRTELGHAMLETRDPAMTSKAIAEIKAGLARDTTNSAGFGLLARAYAQTGDENLARAAAAEEAYYAGSIKEAKRLAQLSQPKLMRGSPEWLRMQDIIDYKPPKK